MRRLITSNKAVIQNVSKFVRMANWKQKGTIAATDSFNTIIEGQAEIRVKSQNVFYNPVQEFNRDLSICVLSVFIRNFRTMKLVEKLKKGTVKALTTVEDLKPDDVMNDWKDTMGLKEEYDKEEVTILEALSATGLRSIRYAKEVDGVNKVIANDISARAVETIKDNIIYNVVKDYVETSHDDACNLMYKHKERSKRFTAIDLDPYGCPSQFLDSAVQSVQDGGLLLVTATDMAVLAGNAPETCYSKYGAISLKTKCCHEMAIRILLQCIESHANRYGRYIVPLLSVSVDFYVRVFVQVFSGAVHCKRTTSKLSMVYQCVGCDTITLQPLGGFKPNPTPQRPDQEKAYLPTVPPVGQYCEHCNSKHHLGGPIWSAPIHDATFAERVLEHVADSGGRYATTRRAVGVLTMVGEELPDVPLYSTLSRLCGAAHVENIPMLSMRSAILNAGYRVSYSHTSKLSIKTDAPALLLWDVIRAWEKEKPVKESKKESDPVTKHILSQEATYEVDFYRRLDANPPSRRDGQVRFQLNPAPFWGPGSRADINAITDRMRKARRNQNKYSINKKKRQYVKETCYPSKKKSTGDFIIITDTKLTERKPDCIESPDDIESNPDDIESGPDDIESKPNDGESVPDEAKFKPDNSEAKPENSEAKPDITSRPDKESNLEEIEHKPEIL